MLNSLLFLAHQGDSNSAVNIALLLEKKRLIKTDKDLNFIEIGKEMVNDELLIKVFGV